MHDNEGSRLLTPRLLSTSGVPQNHAQCLQPRPQQLLANEPLALLTCSEVRQDVSHKQGDAPRKTFAGETGMSAIVEKLHMKNIP